MKNKKQNDNGSWTEIVKYLGLFQIIVIELVVAPALGLGIGYLLVRYLHFPQFVLLIFGLLFAGIGIYRVYQISEKMLEDKN